jgi:hypothetical protein
MDLPKLIDFTRTTALSGSIDPLEGMQEDKVVIVRGKNDAFIRQRVADNLVEYYKSFINESNIATEFQLLAEHAIVHPPCLTLLSCCSNLTMLCLVY